MWQNEYFRLWRWIFGLELIWQLLQLVKCYKIHKCMSFFQFPRGRKALFDGAKKESNLSFSLTQKSLFNLKHSIELNNQKTSYSTLQLKVNTMFFSMKIELSSNLKEIYFFKYFRCCCCFDIIFFCLIILDELVNFESQMGNNSTGFLSFFSSLFSFILILWIERSWAVHEKRVIKIESVE